MKSTNRLPTTELAEEIEIQNRRADSYEDLHRLGYFWDRRVSEFAAAQLHCRRGVLLNNGCGTGHGTQFYATFKVIGTDLSENMLKKAVIRIHAGLIRCNSQELPLRDGLFHVVIAKNLLHHVANPERACWEMGRVLKPEGEAIFYDLLSPIGFHRIKHYVYRKSRIYSSLHRSFKRKRYLNLIADHFSIKRVVYIGYIGILLQYLLDELHLSRLIPFQARIVSWLYRLDQLLGCIPLLKRQAWTVLIIASKQVREEAGPGIESDKG